MKKRRIFVSKRGSYIAEAAIVLPIIILSLISCVLIIMEFYDDVYQQCEEHKQLRIGKVRQTEPVTVEEIAGVTYIRKYQLAKRLTGQDESKPEKPGQDKKEQQDVFDK